MPIIIIAGGHYANLAAISQAIKEDLGGATVVNFNSDFPTGETTYSARDFDFDKLHSLLQQPQEGTTIVYGCYALYDARINSLADLKVFIDEDRDTRLINMIQTSGLQLEETLSLYLNKLRPADRFILETRRDAQLIIPSGSKNGAKIIVDGIKKVKESAGTLYPKFDFHEEAMDLEKQRFYDLN